MTGSTVRLRSARVVCWMMAALRSAMVVCNASRWGPRRWSGGGGGARGRGRGDRRRET